MVFGEVIGEADSHEGEAGRGRQRKGSRIGPIEGLDGMDISMGNGMELDGNGEKMSERCFDVGVGVDVDVDALAFDS